MEDNLFDTALCGGHNEEYSKTPPKALKHRSPGYRTGDLIMNKQDILDQIEYHNVPGQLPIPLIRRVEPMDLPWRPIRSVRVLEPSLIIRYGDKMPGEREDISVYFENINLKNLRNGRKRISC